MSGGWSSTRAVVFVPLRDGTAGDTSYGGGRYLLDTAKGADLGTRGGRMVIDLNFLYHPSCRYNADWQCPLAPAGEHDRPPGPGRRAPVIVPFAWARDHRVLKQPYTTNSGLTTLRPRRSVIVGPPMNVGGDCAL